MPVFLDLTGQTFGRLTVCRLAPKRGGKTRWECRCTCGRLVTVITGHLRRGTSRSCGCWRHDERISRITHGQSRRGERSAEYAAWCNMRRRCYDPTSPHFHLYGGRGITATPWRPSDSFLAFFHHVGPKPDPSYVLDRIDNDGNYEPGNVRWISPKDSAANRRPPPKRKPQR